MVACIVAQRSIEFKPKVSPTIALDYIEMPELVTSLLQNKISPLSFSIRRKYRKRSPSGCGFVLMQGLLIAVLLLVNALVLRAFLVANSSITEDARIAQAVQFIFPLVMIFAEFWLFDYLTAKTGDEPTEE